MVTAEPVYLAGAEDRQLELDRPGGEPTSLASDQSENVDLLTTPSSRSESGDDQQEHDDHRRAQPSSGGAPVKCSAVHTLERDMPDYDYSAAVARLRELILEHALANPGTYSPADLDKCRRDDWFLSRFLLRQRMNLGDAFEMLKRALRFNHESLANHLRPEDFPAEFYQLGGMIPYGHDRKGNKMLYLRIRLHKKTPEIASIVQSFIYYNIRRLDEEAKGKGICIVIDCTDAGLVNADMDTLLFLITTLKNYFPKGLSYFLVHELPWILKPFWHLAKAWVPLEHRQLIKFSDSNTINEFVDRELLPDFMGGAVPESRYKRVPKDCVLLEQAAKLWGIDDQLIGRVIRRFRDDLPAETVTRIEEHISLKEAAVQHEEAAARHELQQQQLQDQADRAWSQMFASR